MLIFVHTAGPTATEPMRRPSNLMADKPAAQPIAKPAGPAPPTTYVDLYGLSKPPFDGTAAYILFNAHRRAF